MAIGGGQRVQIEETAGGVRRGVDEAWDGRLAGALRDLHS